VYVLPVTPDHFDARSFHGEQRPLPGQIFEGAEALIPKLDSRSCYQVLRRTRHPDLTRPCFGEKLGGDANRITAQTVPFECTFASVHGCAGLDCQLTGSLTKAERAAKSPDRPVERRQAPIARRLASIKAIQFLPNERLMPLEEIRPTARTQLGGSSRRLCDVDD
jgi:hypothetical protein